MKIVCSVAVAQRILAAKSATKHVKSTLALCKHPNQNEYLIIHFTAQNKVGTKYKVTNNIQTIFVRFINEGKATIQFKEPAVDLFIQSDVLPLKGFAHLLKRVLENKISPKELTLSSMSVTAVSQKNLPPKKMVITKRSEIPLKGFPRTLENLSINNTDLCKLCVGVLKLQNLRTLNISGNKIEYLPEEINKLRLEVLNVANNELGKSKPKQWNWIGGVLPKSLKFIDLSENNLTFLPEQFTKLQSLNTIILDNNHLKTLPYGFGNFRNLRTLSIQRNLLTQLPGSIRRLRLETLNLLQNNFENELKPASVAAIFPKALPVQSLKECSARKFLQTKCPYNSATMPYTLVEYLDNAYYCSCGKACFEVNLHQPSILNIDLISNSIIFNHSESRYVPTDSYYCSVRCFRKTNYV